MKIQNNGVNKMLNIYKSQGKVENIKETERGKKIDQLNISSSGHDFQIAMEAVKKQPDIRAKKVQDIKNQIKAGTYEIDAKKIAEKMMQDANIYKKL